MGLGLEVGMPADLRVNDEGSNPWQNAREAVVTTASPHQKEEEQTRGGGVPGEAPYEKRLASATNPEHNVA